MVFHLEQTKIERINELSRKQRSVGLNDEERAEQAQLRAEYLEGFRANLDATLKNTIILRPDGTEERLK